MNIYNYVEVKNYQVILLWFLSVDVSNRFHFSKTNICNGLKDQKSQTCWFAPIVSTLRWLKWEDCWNPEL